MPLEEVEAAIREGLGDPDRRFVFPSSVAADHWLKEAVRMGPARAVARERFLSWDRFKEIATAAGSPGKRPAGRELRLVFCADFLSRNAAKPFLRVILPPGHSASWTQFVRPLAAALPSLARLGGALRRGPLADYRALYESYSSFLRERGFYEPSWESKGFDPAGSRWTILFPELIEDYPEFEPVLSGRPEVRALRDRPPRAGALAEHDSLLDEIRWALDGVGRAIDSGMAEPGEIAVTVPRFADLKPYIEREASVFGLPVDFRSGSGLAEYPAGRFFALIARAVKSGFAFGDLRDLLLSGGIPWREKEAVRELVEFGLEYTVLCPWKDGRVRVDPWLATFRGQDAKWAKAESFYRGLSAQLGHLVAASDFRSLKAAWLAFGHSLLDPEGFAGEQDRVFARCVACMDDLAQAQADAGIAEAPWAYSVFLQDLAEQRYVPRSVPGGVRFYDYRVSAGIRPKMHYVLNASQQALDVRTGGCSFLREDLQAALSLNPADSSEDFIRRYAQSGEAVFFSCSKVGLGGAQLPHGYFLGSRAAVPPTRGPAGQEADFWKGLGAYPERTASIRKRGMAAAARTFFRPPGADIRSVPDPGRGRKALDRLASVNVSMVEAYRDCPFSWLFLGNLKARSARSGITSFDTAFFGDAAHLAFQRLFEAVKAKGPLKSSLLAEYRSLVPGAVDRAIAECERERGRFAGVLLRAIRDSLESAMEGVLEADCGFFDGCEVFGVELDILERDPDVGFPVMGRIDRIMDGPGGSWIIDYKSGSVRMADYGPEGEGERRDLQMPAYARLLGAKGKRVAGAFLYAVKEARYKVVASDERPAFMGPRTKDPMTLAQLEEAGRLFAQAARAAVEGVRAGAFRTAPPAERPGVCPGCRARAICREHYQVR